MQVWPLDPPIQGQVGVVGRGAAHDDPVGDFVLDVTVAAAIAHLDESNRCERLRAPR